MKLSTISAADVAYLIKKSTARLAEHPWITTESDVKCALYTHLYSLMAARILDLGRCGWRLVTEYAISTGSEIDRVDLAVLRHDVPYFFVELKHLTGFSNSEIEAVENDFRKRQKFLLEPIENVNTHLLQVVTSAFDGQHKQLVESRLLTLYEEAGLITEAEQDPVAQIIYVQIIDSEMRAVRYA